MPFLAPLGLLGLLFLPLIVAFYLLRLRRDERTVSSTFLWQQLVRDVEANAPWQRLRRSLLLLLQLLAAAALAFVVARPFGERPAGLAGDVVLVVDASASMRATDVFPDRLGAAKRAAIEALAELPAGGRVSVVAAAGSARLVANELTDRNRLTRLIESIEASTAGGDLADGLRMADALAARARAAEVLVVTDDAFSEAPAVKLAVPVRVIAVGRERRNQAIAALAVQADPSGVERSVFVSIANLDAARVTRRLQILADGVPVTARDILLDGLRRTEIVIGELPEGTRVVEARLGPVESAAGGGASPPAGGGSDLLALDDRAWAVVPASRLQHVLLVGQGNVYLQNALALLPQVELYGATPSEYAATTGKERFDLIVFDGWLPPTLPDKPILAIAPPASSPLGSVLGSLRDPAIGELPPGEPLLRNVDLTRLHVARAQEMALPEWARSVIPGPRGAPLLYAGLRRGLPTAVLGFDLRQSDLPLQVAWPVLAANLAGELLGRDAARSEPLAPGTPVELPLPGGATSVRVTRPDGSVVELVPGAMGAASVTFVGTDTLGVYHAVPVRPAPTTAPSGNPAPAATTTPTASPSGSPGAGAGGTEEIVFAVDLFDERESNIAPGDGRRIEALGTARAPGAVTAGTARDEFWPLLALLLLVLLLVEWLVYERDGARRILGGLRTALAARPALRRPQRGARR